jgi:hypothetical protein
MAMRKAAAWYSGTSPETIRRQVAISSFGNSWPSLFERRIS